MADITYYVSDYIADNYHTYTADAGLSLSGYLVEGYFENDYLQTAGGRFTLSATLTRQAYTSASASLSSQFTVTASGGKLQLATASITSAFTVSTTARKTATGQLAVTTRVTMATVSVKTARSSVTLSSIANVNAQAARTRTLSSSLASAFTQTAVIRKTALASSTISSAFTVTSTVKKTEGFSATLNSYFVQNTQATKTARATSAFAAVASEVTVVARTAAGLANLDSHFTLTALIGVRKQLLIPSNTGVHIIDNSHYPQLPVTNAGTFGLDVSKQGFIASIWARRTSITGSTLSGYQDDNQYQPLWANSASGGVSFSLKGNDATLRWNYDPGEPNPSWADAVPTDSNWHHYLVYANPYYGHSTSDPAVVWSLYVDGVYKPAVSQRTAYTIGIGFSNSVNMTLGEARIVGTITNGYSTNDYAFAGDIAQVWIGSLNYYDYGGGYVPLTPPVELFYDNGYVDLGSNGRGVGNLLPTPSVYNDLNTPWTSVAFQNYQNSERAGLVALEYPLASAYATLTATPWSVKIISLTVYSASTVTVTGTRIIAGSASLNTAFTTTISAGKRVRGASTLSSAFSISAPLVKVRTFTVNLASAATVTAAAKKVIVNSASMTSAFTTTTTARRFRGSQIPLTSQFSLTATPTATERIVLTVNSFATVTASAQKLVRTTASVTSRVSVTGSISRIRPGAATLTSQFTVTPYIGTVKQFTIGLASQFTTPRLIATGITGIISRTTSRFTVSARAGIRYQGSAQFSAIVTELTVGDIINIAPELQILVPAESRIKQVLAESRRYQVEQETRYKKVLAESRILTIEEENHLNSVL